MRVIFIILLDLLLIALATLSALALRSNFEITAAQWSAFQPYLAGSVFTAAIALPGLSISRSIWRFAGQPELARIALAAIAVSGGGLGICFAATRLDDVARSIPILQILLIFVFLSGARFGYRYYRTWRETRGGVAPLMVAAGPSQEMVLMVGLTRLTETYLQSIAEFAPDRVLVAGVLGRSPRHVGRRVAMLRVLGTPEDAESVLGDLANHGVAVDRIVVTMRRKDLSEDARCALERLAMTGVAVRMLAEDLDLDLEGAEQAAVVSGAEAPSVPDTASASFEFADEHLEVSRRRPYWRLKRALDASLAALLLLILSPLIAVVAVAVYLTMGGPIIFWQYRPGLGGRQFRLFKFRTMRGPVSHFTGAPLADHERTTGFGAFLRRTRLDELPQFYNILTADMSFVGPRPLLPRDQSEAFQARLLVRPGLTGWAQVVGGRTIGAEDKAALDVWYVHHASLKLDLLICLRTVPIVIFGERVYPDLVKRAWRDLVAEGVAKRLPSSLSGDDRAASSLA